MKQQVNYYTIINKINITIIAAVTSTNELNILNEF